MVLVHAAMYYLLALALGFVLLCIIVAPVEHRIASCVFSAVVDMEVYRASLWSIEARAVSLLRSLCWLFMGPIFVRQ